MWRSPGMSSSALPPRSWSDIFPAWCFGNVSRRRLLRELHPDLLQMIAEKRHSGPSLQRVLGLWSAISIVIGTVIGSGVFLVPSTMIRYVGSVRALFAVWIMGGLLSLFGALTYAELAAAMPEAGGEYVYLSAAYGPFWGYLYGWTQFWVAKSGSIATLAAGFYTYLTLFYPLLETTIFALPLHIGPGGSLLEVHYGQAV